MKPVLLITALCFAYCSSAFSQLSLGKYELSLAAGAVVYQGDLTPNASGDLHTTRPSVQLYLNRIINERFGVRANFMIGKLRADDSDYNMPAWRKERNFSFSTGITELSALGTYNFLRLARNDAGILNFSPYAIGGIGLGLVNISRDYSGFNSTHFVGEPEVTGGLANDVNRQPPRTVFVIPVGLGLRYGLNYRLSLNLEGIYRLTNTDYLDGFSEGANPDYDDHYFTLHLGLIYRFGKKANIDCPPIQ